VPVVVLLLDEDGEDEEDEVVDVELMIGEDVDEEDEVVDVELMIGEDVDEKEEEEEEEEEEVEVLEDIGEELEVEGTIGGAEDVGESDEVGEDVKAGDVEEMAGTENELELLVLILLLVLMMLLVGLLVLLIPVETIVGLGVELLVLELVMLSMSVIELLENVRERSYLVLVKDLVKQEQKSFDNWGKDAYLVELLELDDEELKLAELFTNYLEMLELAGEALFMPLAYIFLSLSQGTAHGDEVVKMEEDESDNLVVVVVVAVVVDTVVEIYDTLAPTFVAKLVVDDVDGEEVDIEIGEEKLEEIGDVEEEREVVDDMEEDLDVVDDVEELLDDDPELLHPPHRPSERGGELKGVDDMVEELEVIDGIEELLDEVDEEVIDEVEGVRDDVEEDPELLHPLRQPSPQSVLGAAATELAIRITGRITKLGEAASTVRARR
ncbi:MAG: hypothetical protein Q9186_005753, partial [Xanthomendoza sp. 1 TL-2023]